MTVGMVMFVLNILKTKFMSNQICPICGGGGYKSDILNRDCHYCSGSGYIDTDPSIHYVKEEAPQIEFETGNTYMFPKSSNFHQVIQDLQQRN